MDHEMDMIGFLGFYEGRKPILYESSENGSAINQLLLDQ
jgi:hypothetical protein